MQRYTEVPFQLCRQIVAVGCLLGVGTAAHAQATTPAVEYDHLNENENRIYVVKAGHEDPFVVRVLNTCEADFEYGITPVKRPPEPTILEGRTVALNPLKPKDITIVYDRQFSGYIIGIKRKTTGPLSCYSSAESATVSNEQKETPAELNEVTLTVTVEELQWNLSMAGAFTVSGHTNPVYALKTVAGQTGKQVVEDADKRDSAALGVAAFIHVFHSKLPDVAPMFGLGIQQDNKPSYYLGAGYRFGDRATLDTGVVFGPVSRLPAGVAVGDITEDANVLSNLGARLRPSWFIGLSFSFIDVADRFKKPFAGAEEQGQAQQQRSAR